MLMMTMTILILMRKVLRDGLRTRGDKGRWYHQQQHHQQQQKDREWW